MNFKKLLAACVFTVALFALSACSSFDSKEGQTSVINYPEGTVGNYNIKTEFPDGSSGHLITVNHKDNNGGADSIDITYRVTDKDGNGLYDYTDCQNFTLTVNNRTLTTLYTGYSNPTNDAYAVWIESDGTGECHNTDYTLQDGGPLALALTDNPPEITNVSGVTGFIRYGTKGSPVSQWNITGTSAEISLGSSLGYCYNNTSWNDALQQCESYTQNNDPDPGQTLNQPIECYHKITSGQYKGQSVKCGDYGCIYPNNTYCDQSRCYNNDGTPNDNNWSENDSVTEWGICRDASGVAKDFPADDGGNDNADDWVRHTWQFKDGTEWSYILARNDQEYLSYISGIEAKCRNISKSRFHWMPNAGQDWDWMQFGIPECGDGNGTTPPPPTPGPTPPQPYCFTEDRDGEQCDVCYNENDEVVSESCWPVGDDNKTDKKDAQRQKDDMLNRVEDEQRNVEKEFPRLKKEIERFQEKELKKRIQRFKKLLSRAGSSQKAKEFLNEGIAWLEGRNTIVSGLKTDMDNMISSCKTGIETVKTKVEAIVPGEVSWDGLNSGWNSIRKNLESCWPHRDAIETAYRAVEHEVHEFSDMIFEISKAVMEMESYSIAVPDFVDQFFNEWRTLQKWVDSGLECKTGMESLIKTLRSTTNPEDIDYAQQDVWDAQQDCNWLRQDREDAYEDWRQGDSYDTPHPWERYVDRALRTMEDQRYIENDRGELEEIKRALEAISDLRNQIRTEDPVVLKAIKNLEELKVKALPKVNEMIEAAEKGDYVEWEQLDMLGNVADQSLDIIAKFCDLNSGSCSLSPELDEMIYDRYRDDGGPGPDFHQNFNQIYFDEELVDRLVNDIVARISEELVNTFVQEFTRIFTETMAAKIAEHMEGEAGEVLTNVFNNIDKLGDDRTKKIAENSTEVYDVLVKFENYDLEPDVAAIVDDWNRTVVSGSIKSEIISKFEELLKAVKNGEATASLVAALRDKLTDNERSLATEDRVQFLDARLEDNDWYYGSFMASSFEGDRDERGSFTGFVRPAGLINRCEALKIAIEAAGLPKAQGASDWWCSAYVATAEREGFRMVTGYGDTAYWVPPSTDRGFLAGNPTRAELCALWVDAGNLELSRYSGEFPDVGHLDPWAEDAASCKQYGIMEGQGGGNFDAHSPANRAGVAAMEVRFRESTQADQLIRMLDETGTNTGIFE